MARGSSARIGSSVRAVINGEVASWAKQIALVTSIRKPMARQRIGTDFYHAASKELDFLSYKTEMGILTPPVGVINLFLAQLGSVIVRREGCMIVALGGSDFSPSDRPKNLPARLQEPPSDIVSDSTILGSLLPTNPGLSHHRVQRLA